ncbi:MAG: hypothetical protein OXI35_15270, partial [Gemmatimonadota bacterium]|nr:hypothetical protein [Gemmatimonadota bacterium]
MTARAIGCLSLVIIAACSSPQSDKNVVARVGEVSITFENLQHFKSDMPPLLLSEREGVAAFEEYLQAMIDMELMLLEARKRQIDSDPDFIEQWEQARREKLFQEFVKLEIQDKIDLPQEEIKRQWGESKWNRLLKLARIRSSTADEAAQVLRALESGTPFEELSGQPLTYHQQGNLQGALNSYVGRNSIEEFGVSLDVADVLFELAKGELSEPLKVEAGYDIYKVLDERPAPASYYLIFSQGTLMAAFGERRRALIAELMREYNVELDSHSIFELAAIVAQDNVGAIDAEGTLGRYDGGQITLADFLALYPKVRRVASVGTDSSGIDEFVRLYLVPEVLFPVAIERRDLAQEPAIANWLRSKKRAMLIEELRRRDVEEYIDLSEDVLRRYYEANLHRFMEDREVTVQEILVATHEEAEALAARIRAGEAIGDLATSHSIRQGNDKGRFHIHSFERVVFGELLTAALAAEVGVLTGPVAITATPH